MGPLVLTYKLLINNKILLKEIWCHQRNIEGYKMVSFKDKACGKHK